MFYCHFLSSSISCKHLFLSEALRKMASYIETILAGLLVPENGVIQENTLKLKEEFKKPGTLEALCNILGTSKNADVRQLAAVLIHRKVEKGRQWSSLVEEIRQGIRENILLLLARETSRNARTSIGALVGAVAKHDIPSNSWPQLFDFLFTFTDSDDLSRSELGVFVMYSVTQTAAEQLQPHALSLLQLLTKKLTVAANPAVPYYAVRAMSDLVFFAGESEGKLIQAAIPQILAVIQQLIGVDETMACGVLQLFDELLETEVSIIVPHLRSFLQLCMEIAQKCDLSDELRVKAMSFMASLTRLKKKAILRHHLVEPFLHVVFPIICSEVEEGESSPHPVDSDSQTPAQYSLQIIDTMALHLPPTMFIPKLMAMVEECLKSDDVNHRRAGYLAMAAVVEGCADYIMIKLMDILLRTVYDGLSDPEPAVSNAALFVLGQFSEHLQPDICKYASELLPLLFRYLGKATLEADRNPIGLSRSYYALEMFIENLGKEVMPYLPDLMSHLLAVLKGCSAIRPRELAITAIGAVATSACESMQPYFEEIICYFRGYFLPGPDNDMNSLQIAAIDTLGVLARTIGKDTFMPLAKESMQLGLGLLENASDPDLRRCVYGLLAALSALVSEGMEACMEKVVHHMLTSLKSDEGVKMHLRDSEPLCMFGEDILLDDEDIVDSDGEDDDSGANDFEGISVQNAYLDEKEDACFALGQLAVNSSQAFLPYLETVYAEVLTLTDYPAVGVKKSAIAVLPQFCHCLYATSSGASGDRANAGISSESAELKAVLCTVLSKLLTTAEEDLDRSVAMAAIDALTEMLKDVGVCLLSSTGSADAILRTMKAVFSHKTTCQDQQDYDEGDDDQQAEHDGMLVESAGDVLPIMARMMGGSAFAPFFSSFVGDLLKLSKSSSSTAEKSFAIGTLGEIIESMGSASADFADVLYSSFMRTVKDDDEEVRSNTVYALGVLSANGGIRMRGYISDILKLMVDITMSESSGLILDNVCAAICRIVECCESNLPLDVVIPTVMKCLPLKQDFDEYCTVFRCLMSLYHGNNGQVTYYLPLLLEVMASVLGTSHVKPDAEKILVQFVQSIKSKHSDDFDRIRVGLPAAYGIKLEQCLTVDVTCLPASPWQP